jgi:hypothetical protein
MMLLLHEFLVKLILLILTQQLLLSAQRCLEVDTAMILLDIPRR